MSSWKQLSRLVNGVSLVAKEICNQSPELQRAAKGDLEGLITSSGKKALVAATDLVGLTSGKLRELSKRRSKEPSVVYFDDEKDKDGVVLGGVASEIGSASAKPTPVVSDCVHEEFVDSQILISDSIDQVKISNREGETKVSGEEVGESIGVRAAESGEVAIASTPSDVQRRRPRERKVPSTPFARAYG